MPLQTSKGEVAPLQRRYALDGLQPGLRPEPLNPSKREAPFAQVIEQGVRHGRDDQCQHEHECLSADNDPADRVVGRGSHAAGDYQRHHACDERQRCHQDRPQPVPTRLNDRVVRTESRLFQMVGVVNLQNRVLLDDAEEHEQAER